MGAGVCTQVDAAPRSGTSRSNMIIIIAILILSLWHFEWQQINLLLFELLDLSGAVFTLLMFELVIVSPWGWQNLR